MSQSAYVPFGGGIDLVTPATRMEPGRAILAVNYECPIEGGYRSVAGYTRLGTGVPGEGPILGVEVWQGEPYAIRQEVGETTAALHRWTPSETWERVGGGLPVGRYEITVGNLFATAAGEALYMVCPNGRPFKWDGSTLTELTGAQVGASYIKAHKNHLFIGFEAGSVQHSAIGDETDWTVNGGAGEIGTQDVVSGLAVATGGVLVIFGRDSVQGLYGTSAADFELRSISANSGARAYTVVEMRQPVFINERGITSLEAVQSFGDFAQADLTRQIQPLFSNGYRPVCATYSKALGQYRVWDDSGRGIRLTISGSEILGVTVTEFPDQPTTCATGEKSTGDEVTVFGTSDGNVHQMDTGTSFAGEPIESILVTQYHHCGSPTIRKRFRRAYLETTGTNSTTFSVLPELDYGDERVARQRREFISVMASGGNWGVSTWGDFVWSAPYQSNTPIALTGTGENINMAFYHSSADVEPHSIKGYHVHFTQRRMMRG